MRHAVIVLLILAGLGMVSAAQTRRAPSTAPATFSVAEATIPELQAAMEQRRTTSRAIVTEYLTRIATYEDKLNAVMTVNAKALEEADARDRERAQGKVRSPLHGIPIAVKDNIQTTDMPTTGGALAFEGLIPPYEATLVKNLRDAGAIVLAKTTMTELANYVSSTMPANYSALAGYGFNPYDPRRDPRQEISDGRPVLSPGGSSSGIGTAASFWAANVGTETSGSILSPASQNMLVGIKPTVGRVSRYGVIPITADQDTPGPLARTVRDAAILLGALESAVPDERDEAAKVCAPPPGRDYTRFLNPAGLKGARIGIPRALFYDPLILGDGKERRGGLNPAQTKLMAEAIAVLKRAGAVIVDPADVPSVVTTDLRENLAFWPTCADPSGAKGKDAECSISRKYGMKRDFNKWLSSLGARAPFATLTELRRWNLAHAKAGAIKYGQDKLDLADEMDVANDRARYQADREKDLRLTATNGIDAVVAQHRLDALLFPAGAGAEIAARPGYPTVIVPFGSVPNTPPAGYPEGFRAMPVPFGVSFTAMACSEPRLIELANAFEQMMKRRTPPSSAP